MAVTRVVLTLTKCIFVVTYLLLTTYALLVLYEVANKIKPWNDIYCLVHVKLLNYILDLVSDVFHSGYRKQNS